MKKLSLPMALIAGLVLAVGAFGAACGDDGDGGPLTLEEYFQQFTELKSDVEERSDGMQERADERLELAESAEDALDVFGDLIDDALALTRDTRDDLDALEPPAEVADLHNEMVAIFDVGASSLKELVSEIKDDIDLADLEEFGQRVETEFGALDSQSEAVCVQLQDIAAENGIDVDLQCGDNQ